MKNMKIVLVNVTKLKRKRTFVLSTFCINVFSSVFIVVGGSMNLSELSMNWVRLTDVVFDFWRKLRIPPTNLTIYVKEYEIKYNNVCFEHYSNPNPSFPKVIRYI